MKKQLTTERELAIIELIIKRNHDVGHPTFHGLTTSEISKRNRVMMFGVDEEAFPTQEEWRSWVD